MHNKTILSSLFLAMLAVLCASCTPLSTFPTEGKGEPLLPWMYPVPQVMAKSLARTYEKTLPSDSRSDHPLLFNLPEGVSENVWKQVAIDTGIEDARPATQEDLDNGSMIWSVQRVAVRGLKVKVDVVYEVDDVYQLAIVSLTAPPLQPFRVTAFQRLLISADKPVINNPVDESVEVISANEDLDDSLEESTEGESDVEVGDKADS
jgi:hypothetical protein